MGASFNKNLNLNVKLTSTKNENLSVRTTLFKNQSSVKLHQFELNKSVHPFYKVSYLKKLDAALFQRNTFSRPFYAQFTHFAF